MICEGVQSNTVSVVNFSLEKLEQNERFITIEF